ncbi:MAG: T9SS type A sorting domain-containing protein [Bacteroidota bacterium]|jgi:plastocyanin
MKHGIVFFCVFFIISIPALAVTHTVTTAGFAFSPATIAITAGDTIQFVLSSMHNAQEVSQATWNANGTTSNGGFSVPFGGGELILTKSGTFYYVCTNHAGLGMKGTITVTSATGVVAGHSQLPGEFALEQNYPNPFNPTATIQYQLPTDSKVTLNVYNTLGQVVQTLVDGMQGAGYQSVEWNAGSAASGIYFYRLEATSTSDPTKSFTQVKKMLMIK